MSRATSAAPGLLPVLVCCLGLLAFAIWQLADVPGFADAAEGCDAFGYQRQAALFRAGGLRGLDTRLETPHSRRLISGMLESQSPVRGWYQAVAPHCHHYKRTTDRVVLQYPPGTGFLMAAFPEPVQSRGLLIAAIIAIAAAFAGLAAASRSLLGSAGALAAGLLVVAAARAGVGSDSVAPATLLAVLAGFLLPRCFATRRATPLVLLGVVVGLSAAVRVADLLIGLGPAAVLGWTPITRRGIEDLKRAAGFVAGLVVGAVPLLSANLINAGSIFSTTYSEIDASAPTFDPASVLRGLRFYFEPNAQGLLLAASLLLAVLALGARRGPAIPAALASMLGALAYFVPKHILIVYYSTPIAAFLIAATVAAVAGQPDRDRSAIDRWAIFGATALVLLGGALWSASRDFPQRDEMVSPPVATALAQDPIVWSDWLGGMFVLQGGAYAAKLGFAQESDQDRLLRIAAAAGIPQLMTLESEKMKAIAARLRTDWALTPLGPAYGTEVYSIAPRRP